MEFFREERIFRPYSLVLHSMGDVKNAVEEILRMPYFALHQIQGQQVSNPQPHEIRTRTLMIRRPCDVGKYYQGYITNPDNILDAKGAKLPPDQEKYSSIGILVYDNAVYISADATTILGRDSVHNIVPDGYDFYTNMNFDQLVALVYQGRTVHDAEFQFCDQEPRNAIKRVQL